ncbi:MAG: flavin reductase family protein [Dehalococcoidia bacterium]
MVSPDGLRVAMSRLATGVTVISSLDAGDVPHGMTANAFTSVSLAPPLVLVCIGRHRNSHRLVRERGQFGVNILAAEQRGIAEYFARDEQDRTGDVQVPFRQTALGVPAIEGSLAFLACRVVATHDYGDHTIFVGQVEEIRVQEGQPLLFFERGLTGLERHDTPT